jgi:hypothetical protein
MLLKIGYTIKVQMYNFFTEESPPSPLYYLSLRRMIVKISKKTVYFAG